MPPRKYYSYKPIMEIPAVYRIIIGMRSNGKTYGWCEQAIDHYLTDGLPSTYVRRLEEMIKPSIIGGLFDPHIKNIQKKTDGAWNAIEYRSHAWTLIRKEKDKQGNMVTVAKDAQPFCRSAAISTVETTKGVDHGEMWSVCFDEFITRSYYLGNEFIMFQNLLSSIVRDRPGINVFLLANTVSKYCPYFREMGLFRVDKQAQGTIDVYTMGAHGAQIAVEYCAEVEATKKAVSEYFCFDNPQLNMITSGSWEIAMYRHAPPELAQYPVHLSFFVEYSGQILQGDLINYKSAPLIFWHPKTTPIKDRDKSIVYTQDNADSNPLHQIGVHVHMTRAQEMIYDLIQMQKTFYSDNETGEAIASWLKDQGLEARVG